MSKCHENRDWTAVETPFGTALLAATPRGLCALRLCAPEDTERKREELRRDFPATQFVENPAALSPFATGLCAFLEGRAAVFSPPLDIVLGTPFQRTVWAELTRTSPGTVLTYSELAARLGRPDAVRAVAGACAQNGIAIAIPCHRVVRKSGHLAGFRWGLDWKSRLLQREARAAGQTQLGL